MHPLYYRGCWHRVSRCFFCGLSQFPNVLGLSVSSPLKVLYNPQAFFTHAASLDQGCPHCPIFPTAASRRSLGRVSVPVWLVVLSDQLRIVALVSRYLTNKLIRLRLIQSREVLRSPAFSRRTYAVLASLSTGYSPRHGQIPKHYSPVRRSPPGLLPRCRSTCMC